MLSLVLTRRHIEPVFVWLSSYASALAIFAFALTVRLLVLPVADGLAFLTFSPATTLCFLFCGIGPGAMSVVLGAVAAFYIFFPPYWSLAHNLDGEIAAFVYVLSSGLTGFIVSGLHSRGSQIETLRESEDQLRTIVRASPIALVLTDTTGQIKMINEKAEALFGYGRGELQDQPLEVLLEEHVRAAHLDLRNNSMENRSSRAMGEGRVLFGLRKDGLTFPLEIGLSPMSSNGQHMVLAGVEDISERLASMRKMQERQQELEKLNIELTRATHAKTRFLAAMSHELRTPLNGILGYTQLLQMEGGLSATQNARVSSMLASGRHLLEMISCVLDLSEIEAERLMLKAAEIDPLAIVMACLDLVRPVAEAKGLALSADAADGTQRTLTADPTRVRQVLLNLLGNAVKFTQQGSVTVRLKMSADRSAMRIEVRDTGPGISTEQRSHLFHEFDRLDIEAGSKIEGAGLGLALSTRLAGLMGGSLGYDDNPDGGSVFSLQLPAQGVASSPVEVSAADRRPPPVTRTLHVLVVDDAPMNRDIAAAFLRSFGHTTKCAEGGAEAVEAVSNMDFDAVLMDVRMPEVDGLEATRRIRAIDGPRGQVPIVALTAHAFTEQILQCRDAGMDSHLAKPYTPDILLAAVAEAIDERQRLSSKTMSMTASAGAANAGMGSAVPLLDPDIFASAAVVLTPEKLSAYLETIATVGETLLPKLRATDSLASDCGSLVDTVHQLAGSAGLLGFIRLTDLSRRFEHAIEAGEPDLAILANGLCIAITETCQEIHAGLLRSADVASRNEPIRQNA